MCSRLSELGVRILLIEAGSPRENGHAESFSGKLGDEPLNVEILYIVDEAWIVVADRRRRFDGLRPHGLLG